LYVEAAHGTSLGGRCDGGLFTHIAEGPIWASVCAAVLKRFLAHAAQRGGAGKPMSARRVAICAPYLLHELVTALLLGAGLLVALRRALTYLLANARRANPKRDRCTGRLRTGLAVIGTG